MIRHYIAALRAPAWQNAYHRLIEMHERAIPIVADAFRDQSLRDLRQILVRILWQTRSDAVIPCLAEGVEDQHEGVWKEALDGLTALGSAAALEVVRGARRGADREKVEWLDEAIDQIKSATITHNED